MRIRNDKRPRFRLRRTVVPFWFPSAILYGSISMPSFTAPLIPVLAAGTRGFQFLDSRFAQHWGDSGGTPEVKDEEIRARMGNSSS
jgi:hypothetical protein